MEQIKRKYLNKLQLPCSLRDMQAAYLNSPHFGDIYLVVGMNRLPNTARSAKKLENDLRNTVYNLLRLRICVLNWMEQLLKTFRFGNC